MSRISIANLKKTFYYLKRNGLRDTCLAALERLQEKEYADWNYEEISQEEAAVQSGRNWEKKIKFSILVPAYRTPERFLREMTESVLRQTYDCFELVVADASQDDSVKRVLDTYADRRIVYLKLAENGGISANTNAALRAATGEYIGLLDHDDLLARSALYEAALRIEQAGRQGCPAGLLYTDEDKCDESGTAFYEPHLKEDFNLDLLLSNNYICHFMIVERSLMREAGFRDAFNGAQDYDLALQCVRRLLLREAGAGIVHIPKVLYHWRCHQGSTAANPQSKSYAYEAGGRAVQAFLEDMGWRGSVSSSGHLGFYRTGYAAGVFESRPDVGAVGGPVWSGKKLSGGIYRPDGTCPYEGLRRGFSGYMHRAAMQQDAYAVDIRKMRLRRELWDLYEQVLPPGPKERLQEEEYRALSIRLAEKIHEKGYRILWDPGYDNGNDGESDSGDSEYERYEIP